MDGTRLCSASGIHILRSYFPLLLLLASTYIPRQLDRDLILLNVSNDAVVPLVM
jgi:hypothetical protein